MLIIRASQLSNIMSEPKSIDESLINESISEIIKKKVKSDDEKYLIQSLKDRTLSEGAKTYIKKLAKQKIYGYEDQFICKYTDKGLIVEDESIALYNRVCGVNYEKNFERKTNEWVTGECDLFNIKKIVDIKSSWSINTFPCFYDDGLDDGYEWQGRAYMMLWDCDVFEVAYCLVSTPEGLINDNESEFHNVDLIDERLRVSIIRYERDLYLENKIKLKVDAAKVYYNELINFLNEKLTKSAIEMKKAA